MRLKLVFETGNKVFPMDYRRCFLSFIKKALQESDAEFYERIYSKEGTKIKPFTYAVYFVKPKFSEDQIELAEKQITVNFSFYGYEYGISFYNGFVQQLNKVFKISDRYQMKLITIQLVKEASIQDSAVVIKTLSPLIVRRHDRNNAEQKDQYLKFDHADFISQFKEVIKFELTELNLMEPNRIIASVDQMEIQPLKMKSIPINHYKERLGTLLDGNIGKMYLKGDVELLRILYQVGIGSRRSQGFGMIEVVE